MNYVNDVLKMLGVEVGERFQLKSKAGKMCTGYYFFNEYLYFYNEYCGETLTPNINIRNILSGEYEIVKIPFKPKKGDKYYYYCAYVDGYIFKDWLSCDEDYVRWKIGNCFRTEEEAETKGKEIMKRLKEEYEED